uniref:Uncharacterized protein n=1 Tax=Solanum lycopersicum TaxID=4081 RepID=A0A3Q7H2P0_SOLLC
MLPITVFLVLRDIQSLPSTCARRITLDATCSKMEQIFFVSAKSGEHDWGGFGAIEEVKSLMEEYHASNSVLYLTCGITITEEASLQVEIKYNFDGYIPVVYAFIGVAVRGSCKVLKQ